ncbi:MAG: hypothetical protein NTW19_25070 [Planctomycetota bacterium]|nr:hypothetical protein [Planctomycetota bacterium]
MPTFLYIFGYETPNQARHNTLLGWSDEDSRQLLIDAKDEVEALEWGSKVSDRFIQLLYRDPRVSSDGYAQWVEVPPEPWPDVPRVAVGVMPDFEPWLSLYPDEELPTSSESSVMQFLGFVLYPAADRESAADLWEQHAVGKLLEQAFESASLPDHQKLIAALHDPVPPGASLVTAHKNWLPEAFRGLKTLRPFLRQPDTALCPNGLVRVTVDCVVRESGGMSSYYGFEGYYLSLLISVNERLIWDARGETAQ